MKLATAQHYAEQIVTWLAPQCERIEIAGSIRRGRPVCNDVDLVCIPKTKEEKDIFGKVISTRNLLWETLSAHVGSGKATFQSGGNQPGKLCILQLKKCQLDVYFATPETFATRLVCRTGSKEHNIWLAQRAHACGMEWKPFEGLVWGGKMLQPSSELDLYRNLGVPFIDPKNREQDWIERNLEVCP